MYYYIDSRVMCNYGLSIDFHFALSFHMFIVLYYISKTACDCSAFLDVV